MAQIKLWAQQKGWWEVGEAKPHRPKEVVEYVRKQRRIKKSPRAIYQELAKTVSLSRCEDSSFVLLRETLQKWFPDSEGSG